MLPACTCRLGTLPPALVRQASWMSLRRPNLQASSWNTPPGTPTADDGARSGEKRKAQLPRSIGPLGGTWISTQASEFIAMRSSSQQNSTMQRLPAGTLKESNVAKYVAMLRPWGTFDLYSRIFYYAPWEWCDVPMCTFGDG